MGLQTRQVPTLYSIERKAPSRPPRASRASGDANSAGIPGTSPLAPQLSVQAPHKQANTNGRSHTHSHNHTHQIEGRRLHSPLANKTPQQPYRARFSLTDSYI